MNKILFLYFLITFILITSCNEKDVDIPKVTVLGEGRALNLETVDFNEDVLELYSEISQVDSLKYIFDNNPRQDPFILEDLKFKAFEIIALGVSIPDYSYGYVFKGQAKDSLAKLHNIYFYHLETLTNLEIKTIAISASSSYLDESKRDSLLNSIKTIYGSPILEVSISSGFNEKSYSWVTKDKIIELNTSRGFSFESTSKGESKNNIYYRLDLLLINISELESLVKAHRHYYDDNFKIGYYPKLAESPFLPQLINLQEYFMDNTGLYRIKDN